MNYNENLDNIGIGNLPFKTKVSEYRNATWAFIDPEALPWVKVDDFLSYYQTSRRLGVLFNTAFVPDEYVEAVEVGEIILRDSSAGFVVYLKKPKDLVI